MRASILLTCVLGLDFAASGCSRLQPLSEQCGPGTTLVSPGVDGLDVIERPADVLWWDESRPLWALQGRASTSTMSFVEASFLPNISECFEGNGTRPNAEHERAALNLMRAPKRCVPEGLADAQLPGILGAVGVSAGRFCTVTRTSGFILAGSDIEDVGLVSDAAVLAAATAGPDECVFMQTGSYSVGSRYFEELPDGASLSPRQIGGLSPVRDLVRGLPWYRRSEEARTMVVQPWSGLSVDVPDGSEFVASRAMPTLVSVQAGTINLVTLPRAPAEGAVARVQAIPVPGYTFRSVAAAFGHEDSVYLAAEFENEVDGSVSSPRTGRSVAWVEAKVEDQKPANAIVRMHILSRVPFDELSWFGQEGDMRLLVRVGSRVGIADLENGFCWIDGLPDSVAAAAGSDDFRVLAASSRPTTSALLFRPVFSGK